MQQDDNGDVLGQMMTGIFTSRAGYIAKYRITKVPLTALIP